MSEPLPSPFQPVNPAHSASGAPDLRQLPNPFVRDVCDGPYGVEESTSVAAMNSDVLGRLVASVDQQQLESGGVRGQPLMLLTAPRAGYGKTHLLGRMTAATGGHWLLVPLAFRSGDEVSPQNVARRGMEALHRAAGERPGWSKLRETCGGILTALLRQMIGEGKLPCANPEQAVRVLAGPVEEIFEREGSAHLIGDWLRRHANQLLKPMGEEASRRTGVLTAPQAEAWLGSLLVQAAEGEGAGVAMLRQLAVMDGEGCGAWFKLMGLWRPPVLLVDHLDGFYRNAGAGLQIATLLLDLAESDGVHVVLSLNQDVWQATFGHHLPSALEDRLTASRLLLRGLSEADAMALVTLRLRGAGVLEGDCRDFLGFLNVQRFFMGRPLGSVSARSFLRHAAQQWTAFAHSVPSPEPFADEEGGEEPMVLPLISDEPFGSTVESSAAEVPEIFDASVHEQMKMAAEGLAEPKAALPQDVGAFLPEEVVLADEPGLDEVAGAMSGEQGGVGKAGANGSSRVPGSFEKLREMLDRLREKPGDMMVPMAPRRPMEATATVVTGPETAVKGLPSGDAVERASLVGRYEALRMQMAAEAETRPLDGEKVGELVRLAGRRFPLVRYSEEVVPGLGEVPLICWALRGVEILFAPVGMLEAGFWQTLAGYAAGRMVELQEAAAGTGESVPDFKIVVFKTEREDKAWKSFYQGVSFPEPLKVWLDVVHLDGRTVASLYAMQRIIREAETGVIQAVPQQVLSVLARELDFFWKRITQQRSVPH